MVAAPFVAAAAGVLGVTIAPAGFAATAGAFAINLGIAVGLSYAAAILAPAEDEPKGAKQKRARVGTQVPRCMIFGTVATAGQIVHDNVFGRDNRQLQMLYALADHECVEILGAITDGRTREVHAYSGPGGYDYYVQGFDDANGERFQFTFRNGTEDQNVHAPVDTQSNPGSRWSNDCRLRSIAYVSAKYEYRAKVFPGKTPPQVQWIVKGGKWYDPRKDSTQPGGSGAHRWSNKNTWEYTDNPFVCLYNYLRGLWVNGELWVGVGLDDADLDLASFMTAMSACDEEIIDPDGQTRRRYRLSLIAEGGRSASHRKVMDDVMLATAGVWAIRSGRIWVAAGVARSPVVSITDNDLMPHAPIRMTPKRNAQSGLVNELYATYTSPGREYEPKELPVERDSADRAADGVRLESSVDFSMVSEKYCAKKLQKTMYKRSRKQTSATVTVRPYLLGVEAGDIIEWQSDRFGWTKTFIVQEWEDRDDELLDATWTLQEYDAADFVSEVDDWVENDNIEPGEDTGAEEVDGFTWTVDYSTGENGKKKARAKCVWTPPDDETIDAILIQVQRVGDTEWTETRFDDPESGECIVRNGLGVKGAYRLRASWLRSDDKETRAWTDEVEAGDANFGDDIDDRDVEPPDPPTGLNVLVDSYLGPDGAALMDLVIDYDSGASADEFGFEVEITFPPGTSAVQTIPVAGTNLRYPISAEGSYSIRARSIDTSNNRSAWTSAVNVTAARDAVPPATPTGVGATGGFDAIFVTWTANTEPDLAYYELFFQATSTPAPTSGSAGGFRVSTNYLSRSGFGANVTRYIWVRAVDRAGNKSGWSTVVSATTRRAIADDITTGVLTASLFAAGIKPVEILAALPTTGNTQGRTVFLTTDNKLYRYNGSAFTTVVDSNDLAANSVIAGKVAAGAIGATEIAGLSIRARHMVISDYENMVPNGDFVFAAEKWTLGSLTSIQTVAGTEITGLYRLASGNALVAFTDKITCQPGKIYYAGAYCYNTAAQRAHCAVNWYDASDNYISTDLSGFTDTKNAWTLITAKVTAPSTAHYMRLVPYIAKTEGTTTTTLSYWGKFIALRAGAGELIVDGAISATKVAAGTLETLAAAIGTAWITNAHIVELNAGKLIAGTITADKIGIAQVTGPKLATGFGTNQVYNSTFRYSLNRWTTGGNTGLSLEFGRNLSGWTPVGGTMAYVRAVGTPGVGTVFDAYNDISNKYAVAPGMRFEASAYLGSHRCNSYVNIAWYNAAGTYLGEAAGSVVADGVIGGTSLSSYGRSVVFATAPAGAAMAIPFVRAVSVGSADPYLMITRVYFGEANTNQTEPSPYADGPSDQDFVNMVGLIQGVQIGDGAVIAEKLAANSVTTDKLVANVITTEKIATDAVVASKILAGEINATKISINGVEVQNIKGEAATVMRVNRINGSVGNENAVPVNTITVISRSIPRTLGTKMLLICTFKVDTSNLSQERSVTITVKRNSVNVFDRSYTLPYQGEQGGENVYHGEVIFVWYDEDSVGTEYGTGAGASQDYEIITRVPEASNRQLTLMEFRR
jgi:hypothetical protein